MATEVKTFAQALGVRAAHALRKDELEKVIRRFLTHGSVTSPTKRDLSRSFTYRSGSRYRLNRWLEAQLTRGARITYRDLVKEYVRLNRPETTYRRLPVGRYCNCPSDFIPEPRWRPASAPGRP